MQPEPEESSFSDNDVDVANEHEEQKNIFTTPEEANVPQVNFDYSAEITDDEDILINGRYGSRPQSRPSDFLQSNNRDRHVRILTSNDAIDVMNLPEI